MMKRKQCFAFWELGEKEEETTAENLHVAGMELKHWQLGVPNGLTNPPKPNRPWSHPTYIMDGFRSQFLVLVDLVQVQSANPPNNSLDPQPNWPNRTSRTCAKNKTICDEQINLETDPIRPKQIRRQPYWQLHNIIGQTRRILVSQFSGDLQSDERWSKRSVVL